MNYFPLFGHHWFFRAVLLIAVVVKVARGVCQKIPGLANWGRGAHPLVGTCGFCIWGPFTVGHLVGRAKAVSALLNQLWPKSQAWLVEASGNTLPLYSLEASNIIAKKVKVVCWLLLP